MKVPPPPSAVCPPLQPSPRLPRLWLHAFLWLAAVVLLPTASFAQATKIFVASYGNDLNDGSRGSPKRNFQNAHDTVANKGQIVVLDTAGYGQLNINKSVAVTVPPGVNGFITVTGGSSGVNITAGSLAVVSLRGLIIEGSGGGFSGGIVASSVGTLEVDDCVVRNFSVGLSFQPSAAAHLNLQGSLFRNCGVSGVTVTPGGAFAVDALMVGCQFEANEIGVLVEAQNGGTADVTLADCFASGSGFATGLGAGVECNNAGAIIRLDNCRITGNVRGARVGSSGQIVSRRNNTLEDNATDNTLSLTYNAK